MTHLYRFFAFAILNFIHQNQCSGARASNEIHTPPETFGITIDTLAPESLAQLPPAKIAEMIRNLQKWSEDMRHKSTEYGKEQRHGKMQRFLCVGYGNCQELLYIENGENPEQYLEIPTPDNNDPYRKYLPVGFLKPLTFQQTEETYYELNKDRHYRSSLYPVPLIDNEADMVRRRNTPAF
ncbi:uncharacterized protein LOC125665707 [Ostrea edulis]|uniref:uncharacterized protein LOC125665707 n=1 Tax=Ostrea edulis TaxID=37623 RepID=UPI002094A468|nr:uncharacterized protein LOC125665707 [Ostrea edulis]